MKTVSERRAVPVQNRSMKRLESIRDAARSAIAEKGIERFSTSDIARISGASIGTVYRYYSDRVAVLDDLYPNRQIVLEPSDTADDPAVLRSFLQSAHEILVDTNLQNPRDRVRGAKAKIETALGIEG